jgi:hypothetical protein
MAEQKTKVVTGLVRFSYPHLFEPVAIEEGSEKKYSVNIIIPKSSAKMVEEIKAAIEAAKEIGKTSKWEGKIPAKLKTPLRDGDEERPDDPAYANSYFINCSCSAKVKPVVVDKDKQPIIDESDVYAGCYGRVSVNFYPFNAAGNKGVAAGLNNVQKLKDGEPLAGRSSAEEDFSDEWRDEDDDFL